jgi:hypothetical protein
VCATRHVFFSCIFSSQICDGPGGKGPYFLEGPGGAKNARKKYCFILSGGARRRSIQTGPGHYAKLNSNSYNINPIIIKKKSDIFNRKSLRGIAKYEFFLTLIRAAFMMIHEGWLCRKFAN